MNVILRILLNLNRLVCLVNALLIELKKNYEKEENARKLAELNAFEDSMNDCVDMLFRALCEYFGSLGLDVNYIVKHYHDEMPREMQLLRKDKGAYIDNICKEREAEDEQFAAAAAAAAADGEGDGEDEMSTDTSVMNSSVEDVTSHGHSREANAKQRPAAPPDDVEKKDGSRQERAAPQSLPMLSSEETMGQIGSENDGGANDDGDEEESGFKGSGNGQQSAGKSASTSASKANANANTTKPKQPKPKQPKPMAPYTAESVDAVTDRLESALSEENWPTIHRKKLNFLLIQANIFDAVVEKRAVSIIGVSSITDAQLFVIDWGGSITEYLGTLKVKKLIMSNEREAFLADHPEYNEEGSMADLLNNLSEDGDATTKGEIRDAVTKAARHALKNELILHRNKNGKAKKNASEIVKDSMCFGREAKAFIELDASIYCLLNVTCNINFQEALGDDDLFDKAERLAASLGVDEDIDEWSVGDFLHIVVRKTCPTESETERQLAMEVASKALVNVATKDEFNETWRMHGDRITTPDENGDIRILAKSTDYFAGSADNKINIVVALLSLLNSPDILHYMKEEVEELAPITSNVELAHTIFRCNKSKLKRHCKRLKQYIYGCDCDVASFAVQLKTLLKSGLDEFRKEAFRKYFTFIDLNGDVGGQVRLLRKILGLPMSS